jgi:hypothetical protein
LYTRLLADELNVLYSILDRKLSDGEDLLVTFRAAKSAIEDNPNPLIEQKISNEVDYENILNAAGRGLIVDVKFFATTRYR